MSHGADCQTCGSVNCSHCYDCQISRNEKCKCRKNCFDFLDEWAAGKKRDPDVMNNPNKMVRKFGRTDGEFCKTCVHLVRVQGNSKDYLKCRLYGISKCTASDFRAKWQACGKYENKIAAQDRV